MPTLWRLTVRELVAAAEGYQWRERRALERQAWLASVLLHAWVKNAPSPQELLAAPVTSAEAEDALDQLTGGRSSVSALDAAYQHQARVKADAHGHR